MVTSRQMIYIDVRYSSFTTPAGGESNLMKQHCPRITDEEEEDLFLGPFNDLILKGARVIFMYRVSRKVSGFRIDSPLVDT